MALDGVSLFSTMSTFTESTLQDKQARLKE